MSDKKRPSPLPAASSPSGSDAVAGTTDAPAPGPADEGKETQANARTEAPLAHERNACNDRAAQRVNGQGADTDGLDSTGERTPAHVRPGDPLATTLFVAGVGASAGGLDAMLKLFGEMPHDNMAFVVVQHLPRGQVSFLSHLLQRVSAIRVVPAQDGQKIEKNFCYVASPEHVLTLKNGVLHARPLDMAGRVQRPIDDFFTSLAADQKERSIGVVLSGNGSDGSMGLMAIRAAGGIAFVQDPSTAKFAAMPASAERTGVDFVLSPDEIALELHRIGVAGKRDKREDFSVQKKEMFARLILALRSGCKLDFSEYKLSMIERRVERRMNLRKLPTFAQYLHHLQSDPGELRALARDILINVTRFFRGPELFEYLRTSVFPELIRNTAQHEPLRLWSLGCSTGQEPYSLAICLALTMEDMQQHRRVQVFASDVDDEALAIARKGTYPSSAAIDLSEDLLKRFFRCERDEIVLSRDIRDMVIFSRQDILHDPPFSNLHLVSCRNLLIYLQPPAQNRVLNTMHYALKRDHFLVLGEAESSGDTPNLFELLNGRSKVYRRKNEAHRALLPVARYAVPQPVEREVNQMSKRPTRTITALVDKYILQDMRQPGVVTDASLHILEIRGDIKRYVSFSPGGASLQLLRLLPVALQGSLRRLVERSPTKPESVAVSCLLGAELRSVVMSVLPIQEQDQGNFYYIQFSDHALLQAPTVSSVAQAGDNPEVEEHKLYSRSLETDLKEVRESLGLALEARDDVTRELKTFAEEAQSTSEELQSANEELETSKEEIQSANEELIVVNEELRSRMQELSSMQDELFHLLGQIDSAVLIVGTDRHLRRYSAAAHALFDLTPADIGRSIEYVKRFFDGTDLQKVIQQAMGSGSERTLQIKHVSGQTFRLSVSCFRSTGQAVDGCMMIFSPVQRRNLLRKQVERLSQHAEERWGNMEQPSFIFSAKLVGVWANLAFYHRFDVVRDDLVGRRLNKGNLAKVLGEPLLAHLQHVAAVKLSSLPKNGASNVLRVTGEDKVTTRVRHLTEEGEHYCQVVLEEVDHG